MERIVAWPVIVSSIRMGGASLSDVPAVIVERRSMNGFGGSILERGSVAHNLRLFLDGIPMLFQRVFL